MGWLGTFVFKTTSWSLDLQGLFTALNKENYKYCRITLNQSLKVLSAQLSLFAFISMFLFLNG